MVYIKGVFLNQSGYNILRLSNNRVTPLHRYLWELYHDTRVPKGCEIDHLDCDISNNSKNNLICVTVIKHRRKHDLLRRCRRNSTVKPLAIGGL